MEWRNSFVFAAVAAFVLLVNGGVSWRRWRRSRRRSALLNLIGQLLVAGILIVFTIILFLHGN